MIALQYKTLSVSEKLLVVEIFGATVSISVLVYYRSAPRGWGLFAVEGHSVWMIGPSFKIQFWVGVVSYLQ